MDSDFLPRARGSFTQPKPQRPAPWQRPSFRQQEQVQAANPHGQAVPGVGLSGSGSPNSPHLPPPKKSFKERLKSLSKKQWAAIIAATVLVLAAAGFGAYHLWLKEDPKPAAPIVKKQVPKPKPVPLTSTLTGLTITDAAINQRPVTAVMIENSQDARPQAGLNQAGVVFEAIAEGGITRFLTLFQDTEPDYIGPVRSVRPYYIQWLMGFDAGVAHVGGSAEALKMLRDLGVKDLDQFANPGPYRRVSNRFAPHNMYSNVITLRELQTKKGYTSTYTGFVRKAEAKSAAPNATSIDFNISSALYNPHYDYDPTTNSYKRSEGGKPHTDERSAGQLSPKVVIALVMGQGRNGVYTTYNTIGSGQAFVFQDGIVIPGTWHKADNKTQFTFTDAAGAELKLNPGQTWLSVVGGAERVMYK